MVNPLYLAPVIGAFFGTDGNFSPFRLLVGSGQTGILVFPSTILSDFWTINPIVCAGYGADSATSCSSLRGSLFDPRRSSSFQSIGSFSLGIEAQYGWPNPTATTQVRDGGEFGTENVILDTSGGLLPVPGAIVGSMNTNATALGLFGLHTKPLSFTDNGTTTNRNSTLQMLRDANQIPSLSYSYTAGSSGLNVPGSLVLGGYDAASFVPNDVNFPFGTDINNYLIASLQSISTTTNGQNKTLYDTPLRVLIDSTITAFWLPKEVCDIFQTTFNLNYSSVNGLYTYTDAVGATNNKTNPSVNFKLGTQSVGGSTVSISIPWVSLAFQFIDTNQLSYSTNYFPIKIATDASQYTLGRSFLQGAVLTVDHERKNFSISQVTNLKSSTYKQSLTGITSLSASSSPVPTSPADGGSGGSGGGGGGGIGAGAIAGIVVGVLVIAAAIAAFLFFRRRRNAKKAYASPETAQAETPGPQPLVYNEKSPPVELSTPRPGNSNNDYFGAYAATQRQHHKQALSNTSSELEGYSGGDYNRGRTRSPAPAYATISETPPVHDGPSAAGARTSQSLPVELPAGLTAQELHSRHVSSTSVPLVFQGMDIASAASSPPVQSPISELAPSPGEDDAAAADMGWGSPIEPDTPLSAERVALSPIRGAAHLRDVRSGSASARGGAAVSPPIPSIASRNEGGMSATSGPLGIDLGVSGAPPQQREVSESLRRADSTRSRISDPTLMSALGGAGGSGPALPGALQSSSTSSAIPRKPVRDP